MKQAIAILFFLFAAGAVIFWFMYPSIQQRQKVNKIETFEQCAAAGYPIMESYPRQCSLPSGRFFVETYVNQR